LFLRRSEGQGPGTNLGDCPDGLSSASERAVFPARSASSSAPRSLPLAQPGPNPDGWPGAGPPAAVVEEALPPSGAAGPHCKGVLLQVAGEQP
jgi:hypothetical protein